jgi:hypothetical protein
MPMKLRSTVAAATLLFGITAAMAQSNEHNLVVAQNVQKGRQGPPAAAVSRPAAPCSGGSTNSGGAETDRPESPGDCAGR